MTFNSKSLDISGQMEVVLLYCCPIYPCCLANAIQMGWVNWAIWTALKKYDRSKTNNAMVFKITSLAISVLARLSIKHYFKNKVDGQKSIKYCILRHVHDRSQTLKSDEAKWPKWVNMNPDGYFWRRNTHNFEKIRWGNCLVCLNSSYGYDVTVTKRKRLQIQ